jgi:hypothetical protein
MGEVLLATDTRLNRTGSLFANVIDRHDLSRCLIWRCRQVTVYGPDSPAYHIAVNGQGYLC